MDEIEKLTDQIGQEAGVAAAQHQGYENAKRGELRARQRLLEAALEKAKPAVRALTSQLPILVSRRGCPRHGADPDTNRTCELRAFRILPSVAVGESGDGWIFLIDRLGEEHTCVDGRCWRFEWVRAPIEEVLEAIPLVTLVKGIAETIREQLTGSKLKRSLQFDARAERLRALVVLLGPEG